MSSIEELEKLTALHEKGVINDAAYAMTKKKLILEMTGIRKEAPQWMRPWGTYLFCLSAVGLALLAYLKSQTISNEAVLIELATNPLCFLGLPLSLYWLARTSHDQEHPTQS